MSVKQNEESSIKVVIKKPEKLLIITLPLLDEVSSSGKMILYGNSRGFQTIGKIKVKAKEYPFKVSVNAGYPNPDYVKPKKE